LLVLIGLLAAEAVCALVMLELVAAGRIGPGQGEFRGDCDQSH
jgi:hypothetical protein